MMTTNEIAAILTMTCDKAGDIATKLQPLAVEVVGCRSTWLQYVALLVSNGLVI